jgi:hypothetical protein
LSSNQVVYFIFLKLWNDIFYFWKKCGQSEFSYICIIDVL